MRHVIVGGGIAGTSAAEELRKLDATCEIVLVSEEQHAVYSRVLLPHYIKGKIPRERVFLKKESWYDEQKIEWLHGVRVEKIDTVNRFVALSDGREMPYDTLLLCTGGDTNTVPADLRGVSYFRTLDDADHIVQLLRELPKDAKACVFGGSFIGCEFINIFAQAGLPTTVAHRGPYFWPRIFDKETGALIHNQLRKHSVEILSEAEFVELEGEKAVAACITSRGRIPCQVLGVGVGITRDLSLAKEAGIEVRAGILANEYLETNVKDVFTAGDIAEFQDVVVNRRVHIGNWMSATMQGRTVARNMAGQRTLFRLTSSYATNILGLEIIFVGDTHRDSCDEIIVRGSAAEGGVTQLFIRAGKLVGATMVGRNADRQPITNLIASQTDVRSHAGAWKDPAVSIV